jgi:hypothetical protein
MEQLANNLYNPPTGLDGIDQYIKILSAQTDVALSLARTVPQENQNGTTLLFMLQSVPPASNTVGVALMLSFQSEVLPDYAIPLFLSTCKTFFETAQKQLIPFVAQDGTNLISANRFVIEILIEF